MVYGIVGVFGRNPELVGWGLKIIWLREQAAKDGRRWCATATATVFEINPKLNAVPQQTRLLLSPRCWRNRGKPETVESGNRETVP